MSDSRFPGASDLPPARAELVDRLCDEFEAAWKRGDAPRIESYLGQVPEDSRDALLRELIELEREFRAGRGPGDGLSDYLARFPQHSRLIRSVFERDLSYPTKNDGSDQAVESDPIDRVDAATPFLGLLAVETGCLKPEDLQQALALQARDAKRPLERILVEHGYLGADTVMLLCGFIEKLEAENLSRSAALSNRADLLRNAVARLASAMETGIIGLSSDRPAHRVSSAKGVSEPAPTQEFHPDVAALHSTQFEQVVRTGRALPPIPGYELFEELGRGGMGVVYRARQTRLERLCALKMILAGEHASAQSLARFQSEARTVAQLRHPNIVEIHAIGDYQGQPYLELEYVEGGNLAQRFGGRPQPPQQAARLVEVLALAIEEAHRRGIVHRDLKPANVLLAVDGTVKIADFGLAKTMTAETGLTQTEWIIGSPSYMAPEQAAGGSKQVGPQSDIYSLGAILYDLLTGSPPFRAATILETLEQVKLAEPVPPSHFVPHLPRDLETIALKCLEKEPQKRYNTALALAEDLNRFLNHKPIQARPVSPAVHFVRWCRRNAALTAALGIAALGLCAAVVVALGFAFYQSHAAERLRIALDEAGEQRRIADRRLADLTFERGLAFYEQGEIDRGLLWMARSLEVASEAGDTDLQRAIRLNLGGWSALLNRPRGVLKHEGLITTSAFSLESGRIATGSEDHTARLWDAVTCEPIGRPLRHNSLVRSVVFSPDGSRLLTLDAAGSARLWNVSRNDSDTAEGVLLPHPSSVQTAAFSPDGKYLMTGGRDGDVRIWKTAAPDHQETVLHHGAALRDVKISPDGTRALTVGEEGAPRLWKMPSGHSVGPFQGANGVITCAAFRPDSKFCLTGDRDGSVRLWDVSTGEPVGSPIHHGTVMNAVAFSPDGQMAAAACNDWRARLFDIDAGGGLKEREPLIHQAPVTSLVFSTDGTTLLTGCRDSYARVWNVATTQLVGTPLAQQSEVEAVAFARDGIVLTAGRSSAAWVWELARRRPPSVSIPGTPWPYAMAFSPDRKRVAIGGDEAVRFWNADTRELESLELRPASAIRAIVFAPDGKSVWAACDDGNAWHWDLSSPAPIGRPLRHSSPLSTLALGLEGSRLLTGTRDGAVWLWDAATGTCLAKQHPHRGQVSAAVFSPDGRRALTGGADHTAQIWETTALEPLTAPLPHQGMVLTAAFSPDGRLAVTAGAEREAHVWDVATGVMAGPPFRHRSPIRTVAFSPDGRTVFLGGIRHSTGFWDLASRKPLGEAFAHPGARVLDVAFRPDGKGASALCDDLTLLDCRLPQSFDDPVEQVVLWIQLDTGLQLGREDEFVRLNTEQWQACRRRLEASTTSRAR